MQKMQKCKNDQPSINFAGFLKSWGSRWRLLEAILGDLGHKLGDLGGHVGLCWRILAKRWAMFGHLGAMLRHLGDKMRPKSAKMSPRWRPRPPRGANRSEKPSQLEPRGVSDLAWHGTERAKEGKQTLAKISKTFRQRCRRRAKNRSKILPKPFQNHAFGGLGVLLGRLGSSWPCAGASWGDLGAILGRSWGVLALCWGILGSSWGGLGASWVALFGKVGARMGPRWRQDDPRWGLGGHLEANWGAILGTLGGLGNDLYKICTSVKATNPPSLLVVF